MLDEVKAWQSRPLEELYPIMYLDAIVVKVRDGHQVRNKSAHIAVGVDMTGIKHVLGIWVQSTEGAKFWAGVCAELANRGVKDVLIVCCDGLTGLARGDRGDLAPDDRADLCGAPDPRVDAVRVLRRSAGHRRRAEEDLHRADRGRRGDRAVGVRRDRPGPPVPGVPADLQDAWDRFIPFLAFPWPVRKIIYTTNRSRA